MLTVLHGALWEVDAQICQQTWATIVLFCLVVVTIHQDPLLLITFSVNLVSDACLLFSEAYNISAEYQPYVVHLIAKGGSFMSVHAYA